VGIGCVGLLVLSCCGWFGWGWYKANQAIEEVNNEWQEAIDQANEAANQAAEATDTADTAAGDTAGGGGGGGDHVCSRAAQCCEDYVNAMGGGPAMAAVQQSCGNYRNLASTPGSEMGCTSAIGGWRAGLQAMNRTVPASCQ
jgi:hypothetical protein